MRLSPLYDLSSQLTYPELIEQRVAMNIGGRYDIPLIGFAEWQALASACGVGEDLLIDRLRRADGGQNWYINVGLAAPPLPTPKAQP
jgi:hypothetical protein